VEKTDLHRKKRPLGSVEKDKMLEFFAILLDEINFPDHKKKNTKIMFRRIMGRAMPSKWEFHRLMGVFSKTLENLRK
jgi:tRNA C32,U32 (ribose-2'-O)-methylase TrmJ